MGLLSGHGVQFRGCVVRVGPPSELTATTDFHSAQSHRRRGQSESDLSLPSGVPTAAFAVLLVGGDPEKQSASTRVQTFPMIPVQPMSQFRRAPAAENKGIVR